MICCNISSCTITVNLRPKVFVLGVVLQWDTASIRANVVSAVVAVVVLHIALGIFISKAYFGTDAKKKIGKKD